MSNSKSTLVATLFIFFSSYCPIIFSADYPPLLEPVVQLEQKKSFVAAIEQCQNILKDNISEPDKLAVYEELIWLYVQTGEKDKSYEYVVKALDECSRGIDSLLATIDFFLYSSESPGAKEALPYLNLLTQRGPDAVQNKAKWAEYYQAVSEFDAATKIYTELMADSNLSPDRKLGIARYYFTQGQFELSQNILEKLKKDQVKFIDPQSAFALNAYLCDVYENSCLWKELLEHVNTVLQNETDKAICSMFVPYKEKALQNLNIKNNN
jgi:tetratricopeptide (TPR) repeat protein